MQELIELLKDDDANARVSMGDKWLVWWNEEWTVLQRPYGKKNNRTLYSGESLTEAIKALKES